MGTRRQVGQSIRHPRNVTLHNIHYAYYQDGYQAIVYRSFLHMAVVTRSPEATVAASEPHGRYDKEHLVSSRKSGPPRNGLPAAQSASVAVLPHNDTRAMIREHLVLPSAHYPFQQSAVLPDEFNTNRLCARRLTHAHLPFIIAMHEDTALMASMGGTRDAAASRAYVDGCVRHWADHGYGMFVLHDIASGEPVGRAGFKHAESTGRPLVEIAYALRPNGWGKGLAQEITQALAELAFERLPVNGLTAITLQTNTASQRVLEKMGMTCVGVTHDTPEPKVRYEMYRAD